MPSQTYPQQMQQPEDLSSHEVSPGRQSNRNATRQEIVQNGTAAGWVMMLSWINLVLLAVTCWLIYVVSDRWWVSTVLTYAPRSPFLAPTLGLLVASAFWRRESIALNVISLLVVLVPLMGLTIPSAPLAAATSHDAGTFRLKVVSCNVQAFQPNFSLVLSEINPINPDVVALQEAFPLSPLLETNFPGWHTISYDRYWVGSRYPIKLLSKCEIPLFERSAGMVVEIETPGGPVILADIHQMTARRGLRELSRNSLFDGEGPRLLEEHEDKRVEESQILRSQVEAARGTKPLLVVGDFNAPVSCQLFREHWGDLQSAFDVAGIGYGYTSPCKANRFWPENMPWARIDHILCSQEWSVASCQIGHSAGSDHRMIAATLVLQTSSQTHGQ